MTDSKVLPFTGERFTPECNGGIWYEHWHRYALAVELARDKVVVDAACGEGYGSAFLSQYAQSVVGIDVSAAAVEHATERYRGIANLGFRNCSVTSLPIEAASVDLIVSFETIEHLAEQDEMLQEFRRVLKPDGLLLISSPNRPVYSDEKDYRNEYHVRELDRNELAEILARKFPRSRWYAQRLLFNSVFWSEEQEADRSTQFATVSANRALDTKEPASPMYYVVVCGGPEAQLPALPALSLFADPAQTVYQEYDRLMRYQWEAREQIDALDARLHAQNEAERVSKEQAERRITALMTEIADLRRQLGDRDGHAAELERALQLRLAGIQDVQAKLDYRESLVGWLRLPFHRLKRLIGSGS